ncbi:unnamed protein product [Cyprideis torosa]|uniref:Uncharacterized protein n=1 Tax=Cyprideis torosa TaxID=163714 RepID=A0A7R8WNE2_9CRUS|nr:unnamed protein product [Cyprideis torosa]CAG0904673.1 unnamed protein product [Cyprideis torosa]
MVASALSGCSSMGYRGLRSGLSKTAFLFSNAHGLDNLLLESGDEFSKFCVSFFCETWLTEDKIYNPFQEKCDFTFVPARPTGGRPSGGLQLHWKRSLKVKELSKNFNHIAVELPYVSVIGVYYLPGTDPDDIILDLTAALNKCNPRLPIIIGGDFNLHHDDQSSKDLERVLSTYDLSLLSNPSIPTFFGQRNLSEAISTCTATTNHPKISNESYPPMISLCCLTLPSQPSSVSGTPTENLSTRLDLDDCVTQLNDPNLLLTPVDEIPQAIDNIFKGCSRPFPGRHSRSKKPWFTEYSYDLRRRCQSLRRLALNDSSWNADFTLARTAYHRHLRAAKKDHIRAQTEDLIFSAKREGLKALYGPARKKSASCAIPVYDLRLYCFDLYSDAPVVDNVVDRIPSCDVLDHPLLSPFSEVEVLSVLKDLRSKAKSASSSASPYVLSLLAPSLGELLTRVFNHSLSTSTFPISWTESVLFFLHKKGSRMDPSNYRTICIENPFLKCFMSLLTKRLYSWSEENSLLPSLRVRSGHTLSPPFSTSRGTPQGDPLSPLLFSLFIADLPDCLPNTDFPISLLLFADDVALLADSASSLQKAINALAKYSSDNLLTINVAKTKCMVFHRGRLPHCSFHVNGSPIELVNNFCFLGFRFSVQLSFSEHVNSLIAKASSRIGMLFHQPSAVQIKIEITSEDGLAKNTEDTINALRAKHPAAPADLRPTISYIPSPLRRKRCPRLSSLSAHHQQLELMGCVLNTWGTWWVAVQLQPVTIY